MNRLDVIDAVGLAVIAFCPQYGSYIGRLIKADIKAEIEVMACTEYPSQKAILHPTIKERRPFQKGERVAFHPEGLELLELYSGKIPDYDESVSQALSKAMEKATGEELIVLYRHYTKERMKTNVR